MKILNKSEEKISFNTDMPISLANAIRRSVNYIPTMAIDTLEISKNDSALYDEIIAHRVGLIPLKDEGLKLPGECDCKGKGCGKCAIKFKLKGKGPCTVYSTELTPKGNVALKIPITLLEKDQEIEFVAIAKMGKGIEHAKFSPGLFFYKYSDDNTEADMKKDDENFKKIIEDSSKNENKEITVDIESWGQIPAKDIFIKAVGELNKNLKEFVKQIK